MGNDGGSIPDRRDLVKTKVKAEQADKANQTRARWFFCALSKRPLQEPIVSCPLGKLYNKDAIIEYLIDKTLYGDGEEICGHIRSLKDVKVLSLTPNPAPRPSSPDDSGPQRAQFVCPLTLKEMNGAVPFVYIATCGCVLSAAGLKTMTTSSSSTPPPADGPAQEQLDVCPQCATKYSKKDDVRTLNPSEDEEERMRAAMEARRASEPVKVSKKKRKAAAAVEDVPPAKKVQQVSPQIQAASRAVASSLAMEEAKRKAHMSDAVKSLYQGDGPKRKETFMTMGTFTRYA